MTTDLNVRHSVTVFPDLLQAARRLVKAAATQMTADQASPEDKARGVREMYAAIRHTRSLLLTAERRSPTLFTADGLYGMASTAAEVAYAAMRAANAVPPVLLDSGRAEKVRRLKVASAVERHVVQAIHEFNVASGIAEQAVNAIATMDALRKLDAEAKPEVDAEARQAAERAMVEACSAADRALQASAAAWQKRGRLRLERRAGVWWGQRPGAGSRRLVQVACALLPAGERERYREEWTGQLAELGTRRARARFAISLALPGAVRMAILLRRKMTRHRAV